MHDHESGLFLCAGTVFNFVALTVFHLILHSFIFAVIESQRFSGGLGGLLPAVAVSDFLSDDSTAFIDIPEPDSLYVLTVDLRELSGALNAFKDGIVSV